MMMSQGPIAIHAYENLTPTDYGVIALRQLLREGIRAVREGPRPGRHHPRSERRDPHAHAEHGPARAAGGHARSRRALLKDIGREVAEGDYLHRFAAGLRGPSRARRRRAPRRRSGRDRWPRRGRVAARRRAARAPCVGDMAAQHREEGRHLGRADGRREVVPAQGARGEFVAIGRGLHSIR